MVDFTNTAIYIIKGFLSVVNVAAILFSILVFIILRNEKKANFCIKRFFSYELIICCALHGISYLLSIANKSEKIKKNALCIIQLLLNNYSKLSQVVILSIISCITFFEFKHPTFLHENKKINVLFLIWRFLFVILIFILFFSTHDYKSLEAQKRYLYHCYISDIKEPTFIIYLTVLSLSLALLIYFIIRLRIKTKKIQRDSTFSLDLSSYEQSLSKFFYCVIILIIVFILKIFYLNFNDANYFLLYTLTILSEFGEVIMFPSIMYIFIKTKERYNEGIRLLTCSKKVVVKEQSEDKFEMFADGECFDDSALQNNQAL